MTDNWDERWKPYKADPAKNSVDQAADILRRAAESGHSADTAQDDLPPMMLIDPPKSKTAEEFRTEWFAAYRPDYVPDEDEEQECIEAHTEYEEYVKRVNPNNE